MGWQSPGKVVAWWVLGQAGQLGETGGQDRTGAEAPRQLPSMR